MLQRHLNFGFDEDAVPMAEPQHVMDWYMANRKDFQPPICNKLMFKNQLSIMFVGGPNTREDFHLNPSSEFYYMLKVSGRTVSLTRVPRLFTGC